MSYDDVAGLLGANIASRAEVLCAMNCLVSHMGEDAVSKWKMDAIPGNADPHVLNLGAGGEHDRVQYFLNIAKEMSNTDFESCCLLFVNLIVDQCTDMVYTKGQFQL